MYHYLLVLPLSAVIRAKLARVCYGLPQVRWVDEENFHLTLRYLGPIPNPILADIQEALKQVYFQPFHISIKGINYFHSKTHRGSLCFGLTNNPSLAVLKKQIDHFLQGLKLPSEEKVFYPHVTLGYYDRINPQRLGDYLASFAEYQLESIEVTYCQLLRSCQTPKRTVYEIIEEYSASIPCLGED